MPDSVLMESKTIMDDSGYCKVVAGKHSVSELPAGLYTLRILTAGNLLLSEGERSVFLTPGTAVLLPPAGNVRCEIFPDTVCLDFSFGETAAALLRNCGMNLTAGQLFFLKPGTVHDLEILTAKIAETKPGLPGRLAVLENFLAAVRLVSENACCSEETTAKVVATLEFMTENYMRDITLNDLAETAGMSISYYRRHFRRLLGVSPIDWLLGLRLNRAEVLMRDSSQSVASAAAAAGFNDANYFSRIFTRRLRKTPRDWRKEHAGK